MTLETDFFKERQVDFERLIPFGFVQEGSHFVYSQLFMEGQFEALVTISEIGEISGRVLDNDLQDDFLALRVDAPVGSFARQVRVAYLAVLDRISKACFIAKPFQKAQTNRLASYLEQTYGDYYDQPFAKSNAKAYRYPKNEKWYALIMTIPRAKLDLQGEAWSSQDLKETVEIINLKVKAVDLAKWLQISGIYPAYHMSKKSWVSLVLDEELSDELLFSLVDKSRSLVAGHPLASSDGVDYWVIPANLAYYDIDAEFAESKLIEWTQKASIKAGDYVFIYITAPTRAIRYACQVIKANIPNEGQRDNPNIKRLMALQLVKTFDDSLFSYERLSKLGLKAVRGPRRLPINLKQELEKWIEKGKNDD